MIQKKQYYEVSASVVDRHTRTSGSDTVCLVHVIYECEGKNLKKIIRVSGTQEYNSYAAGGTKVLWVLHGYPESGLPPTSYTGREHIWVLVVIILLFQLVAGYFVVKESILAFAIIMAVLAVLALLMFTCARQEFASESLESYILRTTNCASVETVLDHNNNVSDSLASHTVASSCESVGSKELGNRVGIVKETELKDFSA